MKRKKIIKKSHLILGLASGLLVIVISLTGCIYAFQEEIQNMVQEYRYVEQQNKPFLAPSNLVSIATTLLPGKDIHAVKYNEKGKAAEVILYGFDPSYYYIIYLNPFTGEVLKVKDMDTDFFRFVLTGHFYLWLPPSIGQPVVATATVVFIVMLISGIVLWWPKKKKNLEQRFTFKNNVGWKRRNYDLHNILGFYASTIVLILALTGLVWGFECFRDSVYFLSGGSKNVEYVEPKSGLSDQKNPYAIDKVWAFMFREYPSARSIEVHIPETDSSSIEANANLGEGTIWKRDFRYFDQYTLQELPVNTIYGRIGEADFADKLLLMNYDIHVGAILGLPGKILAFFASLIFASLPVTGFLIWLGRRNKKNRKKLKQSLSKAAPDKIPDYV